MTHEMNFFSKEMAESHVIHLVMTNIQDLPRAGKVSTHEMKAAFELHGKKLSKQKVTKD